MAVAGYWRNWERNTAWIMREIIYAMIQGNPYIEKHNKLSSSKQIIRLTDDQRAEDEKKHNQKLPTAEELEAIRQELLNKMNGGNITQSDSKDTR